MYVRFKNLYIYIYIEVVEIWEKNTLSCLILFLGYSSVYAT